MTKISSDELLRKISNYEKWLHDIFNERKNINKEKLNTKIDTIFVIRSIIKELIDEEIRKCQKCGEFHSSVVKCELMTYNINSHA